MATTWKPDTKPAKLDDAHRCTGTIKSGPRKGERCTQPRVGGIYGTVCRNHGGAAPQVARAAERRRRYADARDAADTYGLPREIGPHAALEEELWRTAGVVEFYMLIVQSLERDELKQYTYDDGGRRWEKPAVWVELLNGERRHYMQVAKSAAAAGVEERRLALLETQGDLLAKFVKGLLEDLGLGDDPAAHQAAARRFRIIDGGAAA